MRPKTKQKITAEKKSKQRKHKMKLNQTTNARRCVTQRAASSDERCPMRIVLILSSNMQWYIHRCKKGHPSFLKCDCLLYERCGIPCSHILKITDKVEATMIKIQHWKVFHVHFGLAESKISPELMKGISIQLIDEDMGVPISDESLLKANSPETSRYVNSYIQIVTHEHRIDGLI